MKLIFSFIFFLTSLIYAQEDLKNLFEKDPGRESRIKVMVKWKKMGETFALLDIAVNFSSSWEGKKARDLLVQMGKVAVPTLKRALARGHYPKKILCIEILSDIGPAAKNAIGALTNLLEDRRINLIVISALKAIGNPPKRAASVLKEILDEQMLRKTFNHDRGLEVKSIKEIIILLGRIGPPSSTTLPVLMQLLQKNLYMQELITTLGNIGPAASEAVVELAKYTKVRRARQKILKALTKIGPQSINAVPYMLSAYHGKDFWIKNTIWRIINRNREALTADLTYKLLPFLKNKNPNTVVLAIEILAELPKTRKMILALARAYQSATQELKRKIENVFSKVAYKDLLVLFEQSLYLKKWASDFLIKQNAVDVLIEGVKKREEIKLWSMITLGKLGKKANKATLHLIPILKDSDVNMRSLACETLGRIGDKRAVDSLLPMLEDANELVKLRAAFALFLLGQKKQSSAVLISALKHPNRKIKFQTIHILGELGTKANFAVAELKAMRKKSGRFIYRAIVRALRKIEK